MPTPSARQTRDAHPPHVRPDRAVLRPAQPPAQPEHRPLLAAAHHPAGPARRRRRRSSTSAPAPATWPWPTTGPPAGRCRSSGPTSATRCWSGPRRRRGAPAAPERVRFVEADAQRLPFPDDPFQIVDVAFGLRNVTDTDRGLAEMVRVTRPGGRVAILEFSQPRRLALRPAVPLLLPPRAAAGRPAALAQPGQRLPLPAGERAWSSPTARRSPTGCAATG